MPAPRLARPRRGRRQRRLVRIADVRARQTIGHRTRSALCTGLEFAKLLQRHFPEFFQRHVDVRPALPQHLVCATGAFLSLAHKHLVALDIERVPSSLGVHATAPARVFSEARYIYPEAAAAALADYGSRWLRDPLPRLHGLNRDEVLTQTNRRHLLTLALWRLVSGTSWSVLTMPELIRIGGALPVLECQALLTRVQPLPPSTVPAALCAALNRRQKSLGTVLAYVCGRTGNPFADRQQGEQRQAHQPLVRVNWSWPVHRLEQLKSDQDAAASWARSYQHLAQRTSADLAVLEGLVATVHREAEALIDTDLISPEETYDPRTLYWEAVAQRGDTYAAAT
ncbi:MAG TPA: hypothetical protein VFS21_37235 [Roseiflexaceae bacterium]|nr:hypothetical protein [Roseiflexaceae bacterium]